MRTAAAVGASLALASTLMSFPAFAGPADYIYSPTVEYGEREIDFKFGTARLPGGDRANATSIGFGWGVTPRWFTEVYAKWHRDPGATNSFDAWEWENKFQLTETGQWPVDIGFLLEIERPKDRTGGYEVRWGPLFQMDVTPAVQANVNPLIQKNVRAAAAGPALLGYQWQVKYRSMPQFEFGAQGIGEVGPWSHWDPTSAQTHIAGPAVFGKVRVGGNKQVIKYNAGLLFGMTSGSPRTTLRMQAEYEF